MLPPFSNYRNVYLETTKSEHDHGGEGWEFGTCLWSPKRNASGSRIYKLMNEPRPNDLILHNNKVPVKGSKARSQLCGFSQVATKVEVRDDSPPSPGIWANRQEYYRIELKNYTKIVQPLDIGLFTLNYSAHIRDDFVHNRPMYYPYSISDGEIRLNQGMYISRITSNLYSLFQNALLVENSELSDDDKIQLHKEYLEGARSACEQVTFRRNADLAKTAKDFYGYTCQICGFNPSDVYGDSYKSVALECHHLRPFCERGQDKPIEPTKLNDVTVLCSNCHKLVHSRDPVIGLEEAKAILNI